MRSTSRNPFVFVPVLVSLLLMSCTHQRGGLYEPDTAQTGGGEDTITVPMPFESGYASQCMQGAFGSYSHTGYSTKYDVDFDTPNSQDDLVFAPASGTAYVHDESTSTGFGLHINLDLGDGTYLIIAHLSQVFVADGDEVGKGQILGFEGTTGASTGDHVHFGRHKGDAAQNGSKGESVEGLIIEATNLSHTGAQEENLTQDMICDLSGGFTYGSVLPSTVWHPDGTLVMTPYSADVYVLEGGDKRLIDDESAFWSRGYDFGNVVYVSQRELDCYGSGATLSGEGLVMAVQDGTTTWLLTDSDGSKEKRRVSTVAWSEVLASWGISAASSSDLSSAEASGFNLDDFTDKGSAVFRDGALLTESGASDVYIVGGGIAEPIVDWDTYLALGFFHRTILTVDPGAIVAVQGKVGSCATDTYCVSMDEVASCGGLNDTFSAASYDDTGGAFDTGVGVVQQAPAQTASDTGYWEPDGSGGQSSMDTATSNAGQDSAAQPSQGDSAQDASAGEGLVLTWVAPSSKTEARITLSGEYTDASGFSYGWQELAEMGSASTITYTKSGAAVGDSLRFSVEFEDSSGNVSWSCLAPFPSGTVQGTASATYNGSRLSVTTADDPTSDGCGLTLTVS